MIRLLVVDESELVCTSVKRGLERGGGYWVMATTSWRTGLRLARAMNPALVLFDLDMTCIDSFDFLERLRSKSRTQHIPVVGLTTCTHGEILRRATEAYVERSFVKPFELRDLQNGIGRILGFRGIHVVSDPVPVPFPVAA
jgi:CheY-like chemotaxis protein